jgi:hypothetical protein
MPLEALIHAGFHMCRGALEVHHPVGENQIQPFQLSFNPSLRVDFQVSAGHLRWWSGSGARVSERLGFLPLARNAKCD